MIYGTRSNGNQHGLVLTKPIVVNKMLDMVGYVPSRNLSSVRIVEPAAGDGAFAIPIITRLYESSLNFGFDFEKALLNVRLYEIDPTMAAALKCRIQEKLQVLTTSVPETLIKIEDFLLSNFLPCDIVIGNPPYVRHEKIPDQQKYLYRKKFRTFTHRSDLFIAFYEKGLRMLEDNGILSFICSNRWLKNQYGKNLREFIGNHFSLDEVIDLEHTSPFEEEVIAYPAITTIRKAFPKKETNYFRITDLCELEQFSSNLTPNRTLNLQTSNWFSTKDTGQAHEKHLDSIVNQGFIIGIGVATGSDKVFIREDFKDFVENELLLPILTSKDLKGNQLNWSGNYILNPFTAKGSLIDLELYPKANDYFQSQKEILLQRHVSKKNPKHWYRTIDRISVDLAKKEKIILPDISGNSQLFIDRGNFYLHHNLYFITGKSYKELVLLASILMSDFVKKQLLELGNKMNGGYPRWQSQNLKKLRIPVISSMPKIAREKLFDAYHRSDIDEINNLINPLRIAEFKFTVGQAKLFESY
ncbi:Eco57I restriction-modification methylase domain-containing protein [Haliscomenobacter hydrossis]|uniref:site-specific DNA-methyltransferase (adenine-specific) n=1 Tax=Haliscomenobacter hydrossis (strain ATCC 27775 / DSM 1100 / LMG 10767 / O) TaxID=760192 RepID=F4KTK5_HALH1|nr:Eco57I restriction-modification methylase domain-containing protein [Haliscomenobacter hydrossis]AEE53379.1 DNA modification methylase [Haliscomenobacter hydrossis DSM 1100]